MACSSAIVALTGSAVASSAATSSRDAVGTGTFKCGTVTGMVGFAPKSISAGTSPETVTIAFKATGCTGGKPTPTSVTGVMSFTSFDMSGCPQFGTLGKGTLNLAYNLPSLTLTPSVANTVTVTQVGAYWELTGKSVTGSYKSPGFSVWLKPVPFTLAGQSCTTGITAMYIIHGTSPWTLTGV